MVEHLHDQNHEDLGFLQEYVEAVREDLPPEGWCQNARQRLQYSLESPKEDSWIMKLLKNGRNRKLRWVLGGLAAVILIGMMAGIIPHFGGANVAFADIAQTIRNARTIVYTQVMHQKGLPDFKAKVMFRAPGMIRHESSDGLVQIIDKVHGKMMTLSPSTRQCILTNIDLPQKTPQHANFLESLRQLPNRATATLPVKSMDGHQVRGFRVSEDGRDKTVWADVQTGDPIRVEIDSINNPGTRIEMLNFKVNVPLVESLFSLTPPSGYSIEQVKVDQSPVTERDLITFLRTWATHTNHKNGLFPPSLNYRSLSKEIRAMEMPRDKGTVEERIKANMPIWRWYGFIDSMERENDWHYAGQGVKIGDASQPIFWWKPKGAKTYRVILGDLSVIEDVDLGPNPTGEKIKLPKTH